MSGSGIIEPPPPQPVTLVKGGSMALVAEPLDSRARERLFTLVEDFKGGDPLAGQFLSVDRLTVA